jgi:hypothetical protein
MENVVKKLFASIIVGTAIFGAVLASASALPINGGVIQSGSIIGVACQGAPVHVSYNTQLNGQGNNEVASVTLSNINPTCFGKQATVSVWAGSPPFSGLASHDTWGTISAPTITLPFSGAPSGGTNPLAVSIDNVSVMIKD